eukprot:8087268-Pyramimonas_sp.AAC.1
MQTGRRQRHTKAEVQAEAPKQKLAWPGSTLTPLTPEPGSPTPRRPNTKRRSKKQSRQEIKDVKGGEEASPH